MKPNKHTYSTSHREIIESAWDQMPEELREHLFNTIADAILGEHVEEGVHELPYTKVVKAGWVMGFHYCMMAMETGALIKAGPGPHHEGDN
jgi:hypothetical protein